jgi:hypothetical protein
MKSWVWPWVSWDRWRSGKEKNVLRELLAVRLGGNGVGGGRAGRLYGLFG